MFHLDIADEQHVKSSSPAQRFSSFVIADIAPEPRSHVSLLVPDPAWLMWMEEFREFLRNPEFSFQESAEIGLVYASYSRRWHTAPSAERWNPNTLINSIGILLGDVIRAVTPAAHWRVTEEGQSSCVVLATASGEVLSSPLQDVSDRWLAGDLTWMDGYVARIARLAGPKQLPAVRPVAARRLLNLRRRPA